MGVGVRGVVKERQFTEDSAISAQVVLSFIVKKIEQAMRGKSGSSLPS